MYTDVCAVCPDKRFIAPGTTPPRHDDTGLDDLHAPVPVPLRSEVAQRKMLAAAVRIVREQAPQAATMTLQTSDQDTYGFNLTGVQDTDGKELLPASDDFDAPLAGLPDAVWDQVCDLEWDGVVGENRGGYALIDVRDSVRGCSCGMADYGAPGHDGDPAARVTLVIGFTRSDRPHDYVPMCDGYRDGAAQDVVTIHVEAREGRPDMSGQAWAEAVFVATNAPPEAIREGERTARDVVAALVDHRVRAVSVGDTVTVDGTRYVCDRIGWTQR